jgi:hypothetical protein
MHRTVALLSTCQRTWKDQIKFKAASKINLLRMPLYMSLVHLTLRDIFKVTCLVERQLWEFVYKLKYETLPSCRMFRQRTFSSSSDSALDNRTITSRYRPTASTTLPPPSNYLSAYSALGLFGGWDIRKKWADFCIPLTLPCKRLVRDTRLESVQAY